MKISKFYLNKASYKAEDNSGNVIFLEIDYWSNNFNISERNRQIEDLARGLLKRKHRVNFARKLLK